MWDSYMDNKIFESHRDIRQHTKQCNTIPSQDFTDYGIDIREVGLIRKGRQSSAANDSINFSLSLLLHVREENHGKIKSVFSRNRSIGTTCQARHSMTQKLSTWGVLCAYLRTLMRPSI